MRSEYTIKDIARFANVSRATVSRALNGEKYIKPETYNHIMEICKEKNYFPNAIARKLKSRNTKTLGVIIPDIGTVYFSSFVRHFEKLAHIHGYQVFISSSFYDYHLERKIIHSFMENRVEGIVISSVGEQSAATLLPFVSLIPIVFIGDNITLNTVSYVSSDSKMGTSRATEYLVELGHRRFAFVGGHRTRISHQLRIAGFESALHNRGISDYILFHTNNGTDIVHGYETGSAYFKQNTRATAIVAISSLFALGFIQAATEHGLRAPDDYSIIGFDDNRFAALPQIALSTISQSEEQIVRSAFDILMRQINAGDTEPVHTIIEPTLIIRNSCGIPDAALPV
jgi:DNA-binding LacI/PurR family transcriptional regulator